ncbi:hypothetical protein M3T53_03580 [Actinomyces sp. B33]|uniref:hypothetical protein n=1 Tax=Actinomyces sp. B33 TaxID=2942131 RepID=UPI00233FC341|nr:hypothetical protein [Actinomyces sp. B33]MDC4232794.1 hypothetical protein [Actinomyces sp. B33]
MNDPLTAWSALPGPAQIGLAVLVCCQLLLQAGSLILLIRRPEPRVAALPAIAWAAIIILGQIIGPLVFLTLRHRALREQRERAQWESSARRSAARVDVDRIVEGLYER